MSKDRHRLDLAAQSIGASLTSLAQAGRKALQDDVPIGMRALSPEEKFLRYIRLSPEQRAFMQSKLGDDWSSYEEAQLNFAVSKLGAAAVQLLPYIAPHMALAMEVDRHEQEE